MNTLRRTLDSPFTELAMGLVLLVADVLEIRDVILVRMPNTGSMMPHAAATLGAALILRSLPGMFLGLEIADKAFQGSPCVRALTSWTAWPTPTPWT